MARNHVVTGTFRSPDEASQARRRLLEAGVPENCIELSTDLTADDVAAEYPGQTYSNQPGQDEPPEGVVIDACSDALQGGSCVVSVDVGGKVDERAVQAILRDCGAHHRGATH